MQGKEVLSRWIRVRWLDLEGRKWEIREWVGYPPINFLGLLDQVRCESYQMFANRLYILFPSASLTNLSNGHLSIFLRRTLACLAP